MDVAGAFLYGEMSREIAVRLPPEMGQGREKVGLLRKSLYGLRDAPQIWNKHISTTLLNLGFTECPTIPGIFKTVGETSA